MREEKHYKEQMLKQYLSKRRSSVKRENIEKVVLDTRDSILIIFKDGKKIIYNPYSGTERSIFYSSPYEMTNDEIKREFSMRLHCMLNLKGWTQKDLAEHLNVTEKTISKYMCLISLPSVSMLYRIVKLMNRKMEEFFYDEEDISL